MEYTTHRDISTVTMKQGTRKDVDKKRDLGEMRRRNIGKGRLG